MIRYQLTGLGYFFFVKITLLCEQEFIILYGIGDGDGACLSLFG